MHKRLARSAQNRVTRLLDELLRRAVERVVPSAAALAARQAVHRLHQATALHRIGIRIPRLGADPAFAEHPRLRHRIVSVLRPVLIPARILDDEMDLWSIGERKTAVFAVIPDNDSSFNFIVGMLYTQLFQQLYYQADSVHGGRLPVHVHFVMDEFANVALPDEFDKLLSTMRSREISVSIIIQNLAQLKALFEKQWESIVGNCDEFLYLGGNEQSTHEYVSKLLGKETIDTNTYGRSRGRNGNYSTNYQLAGRELMTPDEVRMLDNQYALLFIRGERPIQDLKYDILHHPNVSQTTDGGAPAYKHGEDTRSIASMTFEFDPLIVKQAQKIDAEKHDFVLLSEEELEELIDEKEKKEHEKP